MPRQALLLRRSVADVKERMPEIRNRCTHHRTQPGMGGVDVTQIDRQRQRVDIAVRMRVAADFVAAGTPGGQDAREMRRAIHSAFGNAKVAGRTEVSPDDIQDTRLRKQRIGF